MAWIALDALLAGAHDARPYAHGSAPSHGDFARQSLAVAAGLRARGAKRVGLWFDDAAQLAVALFACWRADAIAVLAPDARPATCGALASSDGGLDLWISDHAALPAGAVPQVSLAALTGIEKPLAACALDLDTGAIVLCTSGSSGQPKHIVKRWRQLAAEIQALEDVWHWSEAHACVLGSVSAQHMYGLPFRVLWPLCAGRTIDPRQLVYPEALQHASLAHSDYVWIASPALLKRLGTHMDTGALAPGLRQIISSGGALPPETAATLARALHCRPTEIYGSSETGAVAWRQQETAWQALPGTQVGLNDEGALWVRSAWQDGPAAFQTSDAATVEADGFHLRGRTDRIVKIEEKRIALPALEQALMRHGHVRDARLGLAPQAHRLTALVALGPRGVHMLRNQGRKALSQMLRQHMARHVEPLAVPRSWRFMHELPWNTQGKLTQADFEAATIRPRDPRVASVRASDSQERAQTGPLKAADAAGVVEHHFALEVPLDLAQFGGHFPGMPVVPGVVQIGWAMSLARQHLSSTLDFHGLDALKFQHLMRPGDSVNLSLRWDTARGRLYFDYRLSGQPVSSGRVLTRHRHDDA